MLNLASTVLGLCAWGVAAAALTAKKYRPAAAVTSFGLCLAALLCQFFELARRVRMGDLSAVADTAGAVCIAAAVLSAGTLLLNTAALYRGNEKTSRKDG